MKRLWVAAALAPLSFAASAQATDTISSATTTPIATATATGGKPDDISIVAGGSVDPTVTGPAVTLNSTNSVTNAGSITIRGVNGAIGILGVGGNTGSISNNGGTIQIDETNTQHTNSTNGIADGIFVNGVFQSNFALGTGRFGIQVTGTSPLTGSLSNSGSITIIGENSAGISIGSGGLTGDLAITAGTITVTGDNSFGVHSAGLITGNAKINAAISATGQGAVGLALDQGVTGKLDVTDAITATGFHSLTPPVATKLITSLEKTQLEPGGPAVSIGGSVGGGISFDAPTAAVAASGSTAAVAATAGGTITAYGSTAVQVGGASPITIGPILSSTGVSGPSLLIGAAVTSNGVYQNFNATGVQIGTAGGGSVALPGGIDITGAISASSVATSLTATDGAGNTISGTVVGLHLMNTGTSVGGITVGAPNSTAGSITASSSSTVNNSVTAIQIDAGVTGGIKLVNSGVIAASISGIGAVLNGPPAAGGVLGTVTAISDKGGALSEIDNSGTISATITPVVSTDVATGSRVAMDFSNSTTGVTINQTQAPIIPAVAATSTTAATSATTPAAPSIVGDVLFGAGNANLNLLAGNLVGAVSFGSGAANTLDIENGAVLTGALTEAAGGGLGVTVGNGRLDMTTPSHVNLTGLTVGSSGEVSFTIDPHAGAAGQFNVLGSASLAAGAKIGLNLVSAQPGAQTFTLITTTGTLSSSATDQSLLGPTPFLFNATINTTTGAAGSVAVTVSPRTAAQLGLNPAETAAYNAIFSRLSQTATDLDPVVALDVLSKTNRSDFIHIYDQFLPDYAGGPFDSLVVGQAQIAQAEADAPIKLNTDGPRGWVQEIGFEDNRQDSSSANGYRATGFGIIGGLEQARGDSAIGVSAAFVTDGVKNDRQGPGGLISTAGVEAGVYWRDGSATDGLNLHASVNGGYLFISSHRLLFDQNSDGTVGLFREAKGQWNGLTASAEFGASYQIPIGRFYVRPEAIADYVYLYESAFNEHGGGVSEDLGVASRSSSEASVQGDLVFGADLGGVYHWRPEMTLGWREVVSGGPASTTAHFLSGGPSFTLSPKFDDKGSLIARVGVRAGGNFADFSADAGGQYNTNYQVYNARAVARFLF